jgi:hypothetical protein
MQNIAKSLASSNIRSERIPFVCYKLHRCPQAPRESALRAHRSARPSKRAQLEPVWHSPFCLKFLTAKRCPLLPAHITMVR